MATLDDDLAKAVTEGFRLAQTSIINQDLILSGTGDVTVTLADGSKKTGPSWSKLIAQAGAAGASAAAAKTSEANALASKNAAALSATNAATSEDNALASKNAAKTSETNAKTSENNSKTSENNAGVSASSAAASLAAAQKLTSIPYEAAPHPDVWVPFNDSLKMEGIAPYDTLTISGQVLELATKSATFTRSTIATYIDKSGVLKTAAMNEPRFEREGLLMEGQSTNYILNSDDPSKWSGTSGSITKTTLAADGTSQAVAMKGVINTSTTFPTMVLSSTLSLVAGDNLTISCRAKGAYGYIRLAFTLEGSTIAATLIEAATGVALSPPAGVTVTSQIGSDGYVTIAATLTAGSAGNYAGIIAVQKMSADSTIPLNAEYYVQMPQVEKGSVATSYIPTGSAAVTRSPDNWSIPADNIGYRTLASKIKRTIAFEFVVKGLGPAANSYVDALRVPGVTNDIVCRISASNRLTSYRDGGGVFVPYTSDIPGVYVHQLDGDKYTVYFGGNTSTRTQAPNDTTGTASNASNSTGPSGTTFVYHIRNFRIWHRVLTPNQINGLR